MDLVEFIKARLDEDERVASATGPETVWRPDSAWAADLLNPLPSQRRDHPGYVPMITAEDLEHIARHDPARVLREVEAKRRLLAQYEEVRAQARNPVSAEAYVNARAREYQLEEALPLLALPYADHPDYQAKWDVTDSTERLT